VNDASHSIAFNDPMSQTLSQIATEALAAMGTISATAKAQYQQRMADIRRDECLNEAIFDSPADARRKLALWHQDYNTVRPHSLLGNQTPAEARRAPDQSEGSAPGALAQPDTTINPKDSRSERGTTTGQGI
jgi:hypothetical protein